MNMSAVLNTFFLLTGSIVIGFATKNWLMGIGIFLVGSAYINQGR